MFLSAVEFSANTVYSLAKANFVLSGAEEPAKTAGGSCLKVQKTSINTVKVIYIIFVNIV